MEHSAELAEYLAKLAQLLSDADETKWRKYIADCRSRILSGNYSGIEKLLRAYGGMGSLNDVCADSETNHAALQEVRERAYEIANTIRLSRNVAGT